MRALIFLTFVIFQIFSALAFSKIDDSLDIFFPPSLKFIQIAQNQFPVFWWNFVVIDSVQGKPALEQAQKFCFRLKQLHSSSIQHVVCGNELGDYVPLLQAWSEDLILREKFDPKAQDYLARISNSFSELSYLSSASSDLWSLKRIDPLDQWQVYLKKNLSMSGWHFDRKQGFLTDPESQKIVVPIQFAVPPQMAAVEGVAGSLIDQPGIHWIGAHASAYTNERQVHKDLDTVSLVGIFVLLGFILFLVVRGRAGALLLFPPVVLSMLSAAGIIQWLDGSIHGLTLAFGSGIVGLAIDYGLHAAFNSQSRWTWRSNSIGLLTTLSGLGVLAFSQIPLLRQMMIFASLGIFFGFMYFYIFSRLFPKLFKLKPLQMNFPDFRGSGILIAVTMIFGIWGVSRANLNFDIKNFNFQSTEDADAAKWFFTHEQDQKSETFLILHDQEDFFVETTPEFAWSSEHGIAYDGLGYYLPDPEFQKINLLSWNVQGCSFMNKKLSSAEHKVFSPFVENICRTKAPLTENDFSALQNKPYLNHLLGRDQFISLFQTRTPSEVTELRSRFPQVRSLNEAVVGFASAMGNDLHWMIPVVFVLCTLVLVVYYRTFHFVLASYIPFLSGLGCVLVAKTFQHENVDLISILGLLMVFGFSVDYGVFVTDIFAFHSDRSRLPIVYSVLTLAALTNVIGFFPLMFAKHPILHQLGFVLFFGTIGTYLGTRWGLEKFLVFAGKRRKGGLD
jgi:hypothetical protein